MRCKLLFTLLIIAGVFGGCRTTEEESDTQSFNPGNPPAPSFVIAPTGVCTTDSNTHGFPSSCDCPTDYRYNDVIGKCSYKNRVCTQAIVHMYNPSNGKCFHANNGCVAGDLASSGWRTKDVGDQCNVPPSGSTFIVNPTGACTTDTNTHGFPTSCGCPNDYQYNSMIGKCSYKNRVCTQAIVEMYNPNNGKCFQANNGCVAGDLASSGWRRKATGDQCNVPPPSGGSSKVAGFDFTGFKILDRLPPNFACAQGASAEVDACLAKNGSTRYAKNCVSLCNMPIAKKGRVAGYDFKGPRTAAALPANGACPQLANAETDACLKINGSTTYDKTCKTLCSMPIAKKGKVAGFDFTGFKIANVLPANIFCPQVVVAEDEACQKESGESSDTQGCGVLCSVPIAK